MKSNTPKVIAAASIVILMAIAGRAQSAFTNALMNLNPAAFWPLQETVQPPLAQIETNYGSLGPNANAYFSSTNAYPGAPGATANGDGDSAISFSGSHTAAFLGVPLTDPRVSVSGPAFSVEAWIYPTNISAGAGIIVSQSGAPGSGGLNGTANSAGWALVQDYVPSIQNEHFTGWAFHVFNGVGATGGAEAVVLTNITVNTWYHLVGVFDGANAYLYVDGVSAATQSSPINGSYAQDTWDQLVIGSGGGGTLNNDQYYGSIDEVAVYSSALSATQIANHFNQANSSSYMSTILGDNPLMYWRMDNTNYTSPANTAFPVAANYGSVANLNGLYLQGTVPGWAGPANPGFGATSFGCAFNGLGTSSTNRVGIATNNVMFATNVLTTGVIITNLPSALNLISNNITVMCWFKANPADSRFQSLVGHGDSSWRLSYDQNGKVHFNGGEGNELTSFGAYNDGNWHFAVGVYTNTGTVGPGGAGWTATNYLYVDGVLNGVVLATNKATGSTTNIVIGGAPDYESSGNSGYRPQRYFSGDIADVAYFTNALSFAQILNLYTNATGGVLPPAQAAPVVTSQPFPYPAIRQVSGSPTNFIFEAVVASGFPALSYQWYFNTTSNYAGATALTDDGQNYINSQTSQVTITNMTAAKSGYYYCVVANNYGATTSDIVDVQVEVAPVLTAQSPGGAFSLFPNQTTSLSVTAAGDTNLVYQWFTNSGSGFVADASTAGTSASYSVTAGAPAVNGETYECVVTNDFGSVTGLVDTLTVTPFPSSLTKSAYSSNILSLKPTGYWPLHEVEAPAFGEGDVETNYGTLGAAANGHYADWALTPTTSYQVRGVNGALAGDKNPAVLFNANVGANAFGPYYMLVPQPASLLKPPFSVECWWNPENGNFGDLISQFGYSQNANAGNPRLGLRFIWTGGQFQMGFGSGTGYNTINSGSGYANGQWYHVVMSVDNASNSTIYVNGGQVASGEIVPTTFDPSIPLTIGSGFWLATAGDPGPARPCDGAVDEVAIYPTNLPPSRIQAHYNAALDPVDNGAYETNVQADAPAIYFHMDAPAYTAPPASSWAVLTNYGSAGGNGVYDPDAVPGSASGVGGSAGFAANISATNAMAGNGINSFADAGNSSAFIPANINSSFSYTIWFKGNPADCRTNEDLFSANDSNWHCGMNGSGRIFAHGSGSAEITSPGVYNDGNWHQLVLTCVETNIANKTPNTNILYLDGVQVGLAVGAGSNSLTTAPLPDVLIGDETGFTNNAGNRCFAGSLCEAAFFNGVVLSPSQVQSLYNSAGLPPYLVTQPISTNIDAGVSFTNSISAGGAPTLAYQWYQNGQSVANATNATLIFNPIGQANGGSYYVIVTNNYGSITSLVASVSVLTNPMIVGQFPVTYTNIASTNYMTLYAGASPNLSVSVVGAVPLVYQWFTNGIADGVATNGSFSMTNLQTGFTNDYCIITNTLGSVTSVVWTASVIADPINSVGGGVTYASNVLALNPIGYWRMNDTNLDGVDQGSGDFGWICHDYAGGNDGMYTNCQLGFPGYSPVLDPSDSSPQFGELDMIQNDFGDSLAFGIAGINFASPVGTGRNFTVEAWASGYPQTSDAGVVTLGFGNGGEQFNIDCGSDSTNVPSHSFRFFIRDAAGTVHQVASAVTSSIVPGVEGQWYHLVGVVDETGSQTITFYINGLPVGTASVANNVGILSTTNLMGIGSRMSNGSTNYNSQFLGNINDVAIFNYALSASQVLNQYVSGGVAPILSQRPVTSTNANGGGALVIPASAAGTGPMTYWWNDAVAGTNIFTGSTNGNFLNPTLNVASVPGGWNSGQLQLTVSNAFGGVSALVSLSVVTNAATITVALPPQVNLVVGQTYTYAPQVQGVLPLLYQWYSNGVAVASATAPTYGISGLNPGTYSYAVIVNNVYGSATNFSTLTVNSLPTNSFASYMLGLKPVGYWPLQETNPPTPATIETNYGTLGVLGNGYYTVTTTNETNVLFSQQGALSASGDNNNSVQFGGPSGNNELLVPRLTPQLTITAPFTMEVWMKSSSLAFSDLISENGNGLNSSAGGGNWGGPRLSYAGNNGGGPALDLYVANGNGTTRNNVGTPANSLPTNVWHHCVATYDGTNTLLYIDGALSASSTALSGANAMAIDTSSPLTIGDGLWTGTAAGGQRAYTGNIDEVAIYTNLLSATQVQNHYLAGTTAGGNYMQTVVGDHPLLYYRMDSTGYTNTAAAACVDAVNLGSAPVNAAYLPGTRPGFVSGPAVLSNSNFVASPINGVSAGIDAGTNAAFNTVNTEPFSVVCWMRGNPGDSHLQGLVTHGVNWALDLVGSSGSVILTNNAGSVASRAIVNDGNWHLVAGVYDGFENYIYVDGALDNSAGASGAIATDSRDVYLGGDSAYTVVGSNEQYFGGAIAQAAFFTNALTAAQIQGLYQAAVLPGTSTNPTNIVFAVNGNLLSLSWPADHLGWTLQAQTNSLSVGINTNWVNVNGSSSVTNVVIPINLTNGCVFYRLFYQP